MRFMYFVIEGTSSAPTCFLCPPMLLHWSQARTSPEGSRREEIVQGQEKKQQKEDGMAVAVAGKDELNVGLHIAMIMQYDVLKS